MGQARVNGTPSQGNLLIHGPGWVDQRRASGWGRFGSHPTGRRGERDSATVRHGAHLLPADDLITLARVLAHGNSWHQQRTRARFRAAL